LRRTEVRPFEESAGAVSILDPTIEESPAARVPSSHLEERKEDQEM
jgi:hypothetical protein